MNPVTRWFGLFSDQMIGPDLERGLFNLEQLMDDLKIVNGYEINEIELPVRILLSVRDTASPATVTAKLPKMYQRISKFLKSKSLSPTAAPFAIFHTFSGQSFDIEAGIPIKSIVTVPEGIICTEKPAQRSIMVKYFGSPKFITKAYTALHIYINDRELQIAGPAWEEYITDPTAETDSNKWQTNIYYPL